MSSDNLFDEGSKPADQPVTPASQPSASQDVFANQLAQILNERGEPKYASVDKAIEALKHSQDYIPQLKTQLTEKEQEIQQLRDELSKRVGVEDAIARLSQQRQEQDPPAVSGLDEKSVLELVQKTLTQREQQSVRQQNINAVTDALTHKFGEKAREVISAKAQELNMSLEQMKQLSEQNPQLVLTLFNHSQSTPSGAPQRSSVTLPEIERQREAPKGSMLRGVSMKDQAAYMAKIREEVLRKHGIES